MKAFHRQVSRLISAAGLAAYFNPGRVLLVFAGALALGSWGLSQLSIDADLKALLPSDYPSVTRLEQLQQRMGAQSDLIVAIRSPSKAANIAFGQALTAELKQLPELRYVVFRRDIDFFKRHALLYLSLPDLLELRRKVIDRIRREVASRVVVDLEQDRAGEAAQQEDDVLDLDVEREFSRFFGGAEVPGEYLEADDGQMLVIKARPVQPTMDVAFSARLVDTVQRIIAELQPQRFHPALEANVRGEYIERAGESESVRGQVLSTVAFALALLVAVIALYFRRLRAIPIVLLPVAIAAIITLGVGTAIYGTFNLVTAFIFAVLLGLGIDFSIHALSRYSFERRRDASPPQALRISLATTGSALLASGLTTGAVFFSLQLGTFRGFSQFGVVAGIGVLLALATTFGLLPALVALSERWRPRLPSAPLALLPTGQPLEPGTNHYLRRKLLAWAIVILSLGSAGYILLHLGDLRFEYDFTKLGPREQEKPAAGPRQASYRDAVGKVTTFAPAVAMCDTGAQCEELTRLLEAVRQLDDAALQRLQRGTVPRADAAAAPADDDEDLADPLDALDEPDPIAELERKLGGGKLLPADRRRLQALDGSRLAEMRHYLQAFLSLYSFVPAHQQDKLQIIADIRRRIDAKRALLKPETAAKIDSWYRYLEVNRPVSVDLLPEWVTRQLEQRDGAVGRFIIIWNRGAKADYADSKRLYQAFFTLPTAAGVKVPVAANYFVLVEVIDTLKSDGPLVISAAAAAVFVCLLLLLRSLRGALLVLLPLLVSVAWLAGLYLLLGWKLNLFSVVAFPLLIGMGIDNGIHVYHRWRETRSVAIVLREVGGPITLATLTTFIGFAGLLFARHVGIQTLGLTAALGMWLALLGAVVSLPALLFALDRSYSESGNSSSALQR